MKPKTFVLFAECKTVQLVSYGKQINFYNAFKSLGLFYKKSKQTSFHKLSYIAFGLFEDAINLNRLNTIIYKTTVTFNGLISFFNQDSKR